MLSKFLLVGVGGSGGKTLRAIQNNLELKLTQAGWQGGLPAAWQFLHIDSPVQQDGDSFPAPMLPVVDYQGLSKSGQVYQDSYDQVMSLVDAADVSDFQRFMPHPTEVDVNPTIGAGQHRGVGRVLLLASHKAVENALREKISKIDPGTVGESELKAIARILGLSENIQTDPTIIIISSIAGGSGAGQFFEVAEMIKGIAPTRGWVHEIYSMLYAPDVFTEVEPELLVGNALYAMSEVMNGVWTKTIEEGTHRLMSKMGFNVPYGNASYRPGAKYNFMVGKGAFERQQDVYLAVANSLTTWITDSNVTDRITAFTQGNYNASITEAILPDNSGLKVANKNATPFPALGFGRVGLGKEKFVEYAAERFARSAIDRMLYAHTLADPKFAQKTEDDWITFYADKSLFEFIDDLKLNEETEEHNDIIDSIRPDRGALYAEFKNAVALIANETLDPKSQSQSLIEWDESLQNGFNRHVETFLSRDAYALNENLRPWVMNKKTEILAATSRYVSQQGIKVTAEILRRVADKLITVSAELRAEANVSLKYSRDLSTYIRGELGQIPEKDQSEISVDNPYVEAALEHVVDSLSFRAEAALKQQVANLISDMSHNFFDPLRSDLMGIYKGLLSSKEDFEYWTEETSNAVPNRFFPAKNEKLLIDTQEYPAEFSRLVNNSVTESKRSNALSVVIDEIIMGAYKIENLDPRNTWKFIEVSKDWIPEIKEAREDSQQLPQEGRFEVSIEPDDYLKRARMWMKQMGTPFANYQNENLAMYLNKGEDRSDTKARQQKFVSKLAEAIDNGAPMVTYNQALMSQVHNNQASISTVVSTFPIATTDPIYAEVEKVLKQRNLLDSVGAFDPQSPVQHIDFFSIHQGVEPMVIDSIMAPIGNFWEKFNGKPSTRESLMQHKRPRYMWESIPAAETVKLDVLKGFFAAKALKQFKTDKSLSQEEETVKGPRLALWSGDAAGWVEFPHPLYSVKRVRENDYPGAVLASITLAIVASNTKHSLTPLEPYKRLTMIADIDTPSSPVRNWIEYADTQLGPQPAADRAGTASDTPAGRKSALIEFVDAQIKKYEDRFRLQSLPAGREGAMAKDVTWEIRDHLIEALNSLKHDIASLEVGDSDGDGD